MYKELQRMKTVKILSLVEVASNQYHGPWRSKNVLDVETSSFFQRIKTIALNSVHMVTVIRKSN